MKREIIKPDNEAHWLDLRKNDITSTEVSALFGLNPYLTVFELWHRKKNRLAVEFEPNEDMRWGTRFEPAIAAGIAEDNGWKIRRMNEYMRIPDLKIGSSFDYVIEEIRSSAVPDNGFVPISDGGILEIKNVNQYVFNEKWIDNGDTLEAPLHIELQVQHQMLISERKQTYIGVLVGGSRARIINRKSDEAVHDAIKNRVADFWESIDKNKEPRPDFARDYKFISDLYNYAEPGKVFDARNNTQIKLLADEYRALGGVIKSSKTRQEEIKGQILTMIGESEKVVGDEFSVTAGIVGPTWIEAYERKGYRNFKFYFKKGKEVENETN